MNNFNLKLIFSLLISPILMLFNPYILLIKALGILVIIDVITGIMSARKEGVALTSKALWQKVPKVALFLCALAAASVSSPLLTEFGIEAHQAGKWFCALYGAYELFSILENLGRLGLPIAKPMADLLKSKLPTDVQNNLKE